MNKMRLTRDKKWFFQFFPYHQMYMDNDLVKGWVSINYLTDGETRYWALDSDVYATQKWYGRAIGAYG